MLRPRASLGAPRPIFDGAGGPPAPHLRGIGRAHGKETTRLLVRLPLKGATRLRGGEIRTHDLLYPKQAHYQTMLHLVRPLVLARPTAARRAAMAQAHL